MSINKANYILCCVACFLGVFVSGQLQAESIRYHKDSRNTVKFVTNPSTPAVTIVGDAETLARAYLKHNAGQFGLSKTLEGLSLTKTQKSLLATHFHFQQRIKNIDVYRSEIVVSINNSELSVMKAYNNTYPVSKSHLDYVNTKNTDDVRTGKSALTTVWQLQPKGSFLRAAPSSKLVYVHTGKHFKKVYVVSLQTNKIKGSWEYLVSAYDGTIVKMTRLDTPIKKVDGFADFKTQRNKFSDKTSISFDEALRVFQQKMKQKKALEKSTFSRATGTAKVFDPDPRTTLNTEAITHTSSADVFTQAYFTKDLLDITLDGGVYSLVGPWVTVTDFEPPNAAPSTTVDGQWTSLRDEVAFFDTMVYYHIDQSQRYLQSLGFTGATGIQEASIAVDAHGLDGVDNAYFLPGSNQIAFGNPSDCVGNAEDADVILHEYGHAINHGIADNSWFGGDTGAMGEGFGDYWAGSYSVSALNGLLFHPEWVFSWNGHGGCWAGRFLNRTDMRYDPSRLYPAHFPVDGGQSDELWSTPLFQSLIELLALGVPREEVDTIIVEAHFGLGAGVTMPEMAQAIILTARTLQPEGPHADTFIKYFKLMNLLQPTIVVGDLTISAVGSNNQVDPGELIALHVPVTNSGVVPIDSLTGNLLNTSVGGVPLADINYPTVEAGQTSDAEPFRLQVAQTQECGSNIPAFITFEYFDDFTEELFSIEKRFNVEVGEKIWGLEFVSTELAIPDDKVNGVSSVLNYSGDAIIDTGNFRVWLDISHTYVGDLLIKITPPSGNVTVPVWQYGFEDGLTSEDDILGYIPGDFTGASELFGQLNGEDPNGEWTLTIVDSTAQDDGVLHGWGISLVEGGECGVPVDSSVAVIGELNVTNAGSNDKVDPGELVEVSVPLINNDSSAFTGISATLTAGAGVDVPVATVDVSSVSAFAQEEIAPFQLLIPASYNCAQDIPLTLNATYTNSEGITQIAHELRLNVGSPELLIHSNTDELLIPDLDSVVSELNVTDDTLISEDSLSVSLNLTHTWGPDLRVILTSPAGTSVVLLAPEAAQSVFQEVIGDLPVDYSPVESLNAFIGESAQGVWILSIADEFSGDEGTLHSWGLNFAGAEICEAPPNTTPVAVVSASSLAVNEGASVTFSAADSSDADGIVQQYLWTQLSGPNVVLSTPNTAASGFTAPSVTTQTTLQFNVVVTDNRGGTDTVLVSVVVNNTTPASNANSGGGGGSMSWLMLLSLLLLIHNKKVKKA